MRTDGDGTEECDAFRIVTTYNYLTFKSDLIGHLLDWLNLHKKQTTYYANPTRDAAGETKELSDCGVVRVSYGDKLLS